MGFFDKVKKAFESKKEDESQDSVNDEVIDKNEPIESLNDNEEIQSEYSEEIPANIEIIDEPTPNEKNRNFRNLDELIHSGVKEIVLDSDIVLGPDEESQYLNGINLDVDDLTIDGNGHAIDALGLTRIFYCTGKNITIKNIILKNGFTKGKGGAIYNIIGKLTIAESTFAQNAAQGDGGAISNLEGELTITESTISQNSAQEVGGAIDNTRGELTITATVLRENTAKLSSGAIFSSGRLTIAESSLIENASQGDAGAIKNYGGTLALTRSSLEGNTAQKDCGAIYNEKGELTIIGSTLMENTAKTGGAIYNFFRGELTIIESTLMGNTAQIGGAIYNGGELTITDSTLNTNTAELGGGAIYSRNKIYMNNCTLIDNLQPPVSFVENNNKYDIRWDDDLISSDDVTIYLDNKCDGKYNIRSKLIEWNKILSNGPHEIILESNDNNKIVMNFTYSSDIVTTNVNNYADLINSINKAKHIITPQYVINLNKGDYNATNTFIWNSFSDSNLIINGNGITLNGQNAYQFIKIGTNAHLTIKNIKLTNYIAYSGGAIDNKGELTIIDSALTDNTANSNGGAIDNKGELTIIDSALTDNTANSNGGAIDNGGELTIIDSALTDNTANSNGGAIDNKAELTITDSTLSGNTAQEDGGSIRNWGELTITESTINNNAAQEGGGAIRNDSNGELAVIRSTLQENTAQCGGAINNSEGASLTITESTLTGNTASSGGAIWNRRGNFKIFNCEFLNNNSSNNIILNNDSLQIHKTIFKDNQSNFIVLNDGDESNLGIFNGEFSENDVGVSVLCNAGKFCGVEKTVFQNNISDNKINIINKSELTLTDPKIKDEGKSIINEKYILIRDSSPELENKIWGNGAVENIKSRIPKGEIFDFGYLDEKIREINTKEIILDHDIIFEDYERDFYEGGIELDMDDLIINGNGHTIDGADKSRIFIITGKNITLKNIIFKNGYSHKSYDNPLNNNGGAIRINHDRNIIIENCEFLNNASDESGGAICNSGELTISDSIINDNTAIRDGGAICNSGGLTITDSILASNTAQDSGGAICNSGGLTITGSTFTENTTQKGYGGAIDNGGELTISDSTLNDNVADHDGGAICNGSGGELTIYESMLNNNTTKGKFGNGGAIDNRYGELAITGSTLSGNTAYDGGAICNGSGGELTISDSIINDNAASRDGGAIYSGGELTISDSTLNDNVANHDGGAICNGSGGELTISESELSGNAAKENGGAIRNCGELTITDSILHENTAYLVGGILSDSAFESENNTFKDNKSDYEDYVFQV